MGRFVGEIGFSEEKEVSTDVWESSIVYKPYSGDIIRNTQRYENGQKVNFDLTLNNTISIIADPSVFDNLHKIVAVKMNGASWKVTSIETKRPRLLLTLGGVYSE
jgi:hypothetical protein